MFKSSIGEHSEELRASLAAEAHVWLSNLEVWQRFPLLNEADEERARTLRHPDAQASFVAGRSLLRFALSQYGAVEPSAWEFGASRLGRPEITGPDSAPRLRFNLTHTRGLAACVVSASADCGIDVEQLERPLRPLRIAEHSFAAEEFLDLEDRPPEELRESFFSYWTLKESYYKARGSGIPFRMAGARFELDGPGGIEFAPSEDEDTRPTDWQFGLFRPTLEHILAVALAPGSSRRLELRFFSETPQSEGPAFVESSPSVLRETPREVVV